MTRRTEEPHQGESGWEEATGFKKKEKLKCIKFTLRMAYFISVSALPM